MGKGEKKVSFFCLKHFFEEEEFKENKKKKLKN